MVVDSAAYAVLNLNILLRQDEIFDITGTKHILLYICLNNLFNAKSPDDLVNGHKTEAVLAVNWREATGMVLATSVVFPLDGHQKKGSGELCMHMALLIFFIHSFLLYGKDCRYPSCS